MTTEEKETLTRLLQDFKAAKTVYEESGIRKLIFGLIDSPPVSLGERAETLWGCYMEGTDELGISDDILLSVHSTAAGAHENSMRMQKEYGGKHYTDKVVIHA